MTDIITRYFEDPAHARAVRFELIHRRRFPLKIIGLYESADGLADALTQADVDPATAKEYQKRVKKSGSVLLVRAGYKPLSVGRTTREVMADMGATEIDGLNEENFVKETASPRSSVLRDHPHMMFRPRDPLYDNVHMADWPIGLINRRKPTSASVVKPHGYMASWPIGHLVPHRIRYGRFPFDFIIPGHKHQADKPIGLLVPHEKRYGAFPFGFLVPHNKRYGAFPFGLLIPGNKFQAKFPFAHLVPGGRRMANWPFPLLINQKTGGNALIPKAPRMANFPIPLLSERKPYADSAIPRHGRMANFPIPLLSKRKPITASVFEPHARMANFPLPLIANFSLSKMLGLRTVATRQAAR